MKTEKHDSSFMSFTPRTNARLHDSTIKHYMAVKGVPFKQAFLTVALNGNVFFDGFHVFGHVLLWTLCSR